MNEQKFFASRDDKITPQEIAHAELARKLASSAWYFWKMMAYCPYRKKAASLYTETV